MGGRVWRAKMRSLGGHLHEMGLAMYNIVFPEVFKIKEWFFSIFLIESLPNWGEALGLRARNKGKMLGFGNQILKVGSNAGYFCRREE